MKPLLFATLLLSFFCVDAQKKYIGPPNNVGREYGNPKMPMMVSHLAGKNREMLKRANKNSKHSFFGKVLCFRRLCRIQSGHSASLKSISFKKFEKKVKKNAKKGLYKRPQYDSARRSAPVPTPPPKLPVADTVAAPLPTVKADSLIVLGAEVLFETNKSTLRSEHFGSLKSIVDYLVAHPERSVKVSGHTDNTGSEPHNLNLSKRRAEVVAEYLVSNGVDIDHVKTFGYGSSKPLVPNSTDEGRRKNRRVELLIHDE